ncbi:MAG: hypothetical protein V4438_01210 [Patescibacteria group bacterium]
MQKKPTKTLNKMLSVIALSAIIGFAAAQAAPTFAAEGDVKVTIDKYINGVQATAESASSTSFQMSSTWDAANIGAGTGTYALSSTGFNSPNPYEAVTADMSSGASYTTSEITDENVGAACSGTTTPFALAGYTSGDTLAEAQSATPSLTPPALTGITTDKFIIVWNTDCSDIVPPPPTTVKVQINKFVDGVQATAGNASSTSFLMNATWASTNFGSGTGQYTLDPTNSPAYQQSTVDFNSGADYSTSEVLDSNVGAACSGTTTPFALAGYTTGDSFAAAASGTPSLTIPAFTDITSNKYVVVWNSSCNATSTGGTIGGDVVEASTTLAVTSIDTARGSAIADGSFADGWVYIFHVRVPSNEPDVAMKFSNWLATTGSSTIPVANNMRISSQQASSTSPIVLTAADTYSSPDMHIIGDLDPVMPGKQIEIKVEVSVPTGTANGSYTTNYGVRSL